MVQTGRCSRRKESSRAAHPVFARLIGVVVMLCLPAIAARAFDADAPAIVKFTITASSQSASGVAIEAEAWDQKAHADRPVATTRTGADGKAELSFKLPINGDSSIPWSDFRVHVSLPGAYPQDMQFRYFPGARYERAIALEPAQTMTLHLKGSDGKPMPFQNLFVRYTRSQSDTSGYWQKGYTDPAGDATFIRPAGKWIVTVQLSSGEQIPLADPGAEATVTLTPRQMTGLKLPGRLEGQLLDSDGKPARGWQVGTRGPHGDYLRETAHDNSGWGMEIIKVGDDGRFTLDYCYDNLWLYTPQGVPIVYRLSPANWDGRAQKITLQAPPIRRMHATQLLLADGSPAADLQLTPGLNIPFGNDSTRYGPHLSAILTDKQGWASFPIFFGQRPEWSNTDGKLRFLEVQKYDKVALLPPRSDSVWTGPKTRPRALKKITPAVTDENGGAISDAAFWYPTGDCITGAEPFFLQCKDDRQNFVLISRDSSQISFSARAPGYLHPISHSSRLEGTQDQSVTLQFTAKQNEHGPSGRVVDSDGKGMPRVLLNIWQQEGETVRPVGWDIQTDDSGAFLFPDRHGGRLAIADRAMRDLADPIDVKGTDANLLIRLRPAAKLKILVPELAWPTTLAMYRRNDSGEFSIDTISYIAADRAESTITMPPVPPGIFRIETHRIALPHHFNGDPLLAPTLEIDPMKIDLKAGENVVDLRKRPLTLPVLPRGKATITVRSENKPVSGAAVYVFATPAVENEELITAARDLNSPRRTVRDKAQATLTAGRYVGLGVARAVADMADAEAMARVEEIEKAVNVGDHPLVAHVCSDLSDADGTVPLPVEVGRRYVVVARLPGKAVGLATFWAADKGNYAIDLKPSAVLEVSAPREAGHSGRQYLNLSLRKMPMEESDAMLKILDMAHLCDYPCVVLEDPEGTFIVEDLPAGASVSVKLWDSEDPANAAIVTLDPGKPVTKVELKGKPG